MALGYVPYRKKIQDEQDFRSAVERTLKGYNISDNAIDEIMQDFGDFVTNTVIAELAEILTIMYQGDIERLISDILAVKLLGGDK